MGSPHVPPTLIRLALVLALALPLAVPAPAAAGSITPPGTDPQIEAFVDSVSASNLLATIMTLQGFFTRHTNSDTVSTTVGIGAARRWVHSRFQQISSENDGNLQVSYDSFTATISGVTKLHRNVVATLPGTNPASASRQIIVSGHLDSRNNDNNDAVGFAPGANDDGSGVAALLEVARILSKSSHEATIKFIAFTGEEQGLFGSEHYAGVAAANGDTIDGDFNSDIMGNVVYGEVGVGDSLALDSTHVRMFSEGPSTSSSRQMARLGKIYAESYVPMMEVNLIPDQDRPGRGGDHISFNTEGFTAIRFMDQFDNLIHQHAIGDSFQVMNFPYFARNTGIELATVANMARAPRPVANAVVGNLGDSTGFRVAWSANPEADVAGYRVTTRRLDQLQYETVVDLGEVLTYTIASSPSETLAVGVAAYDSAGHLGLATEVVGILSTIPFAPTGIVAIPNATQILVDWANSPEGDIVGYNLYSASNSAGPYIKRNAVLLTSSQYTDVMAVPGQFVYYKATAVDAGQNESPLSEFARGRLVSKSKGILLIDETANLGGSQPHLPTEAQSDTFYAHVLQNLPHDTFDMDSINAAGGLTLSDLGAYGSVIWVADDRNTLINGVPAISQFLKENTEALADYMDLGGNVVLFGWKPVGGFSEEYPVLFAEGDFLFDYFKVCLTAVTGPGQYFWGATGLDFPSVVVDTAKARTQWVGKLPDMEYITAVAPGGEVASTFRSSAPDSLFANLPNGLYFDGGSFRTLYFAFPLYHLRENDARALVTEAMEFFQETGTVGVGDGTASSLPARIELRNFPNPGTPGTTFSYALPRATDVELVIFSTSGQRVRVVEKRHREAGRYTVPWDGRDASGSEVASGVYLYRLKAGGMEEKRKLVLFR